MTWKLPTDDREILVYCVELTADIDFFVYIMRIENNLHPYETVTQRTSWARMASKIWIMNLIN